MMVAVVTESNKDKQELRDLFGSKIDRQKAANEFKSENSKIKIAIVVDMWLTGFDVPSLSTLYLDKPMKGHNLMQAIARVNRVYKDKEAGLIVDYIGVVKALRKALADYTGNAGGTAGDDPTLDKEELLKKIDKTEFLFIYKKSFNESFREYILHSATQCYLGQGCQTALCAY